MIGERVRHARDFCNITQTELGELAGLAQSQISDIELSRDADPKREDIEKIARATGFPTSFFYLGPLPDFPEGNFRRLARGKARATRQVRAQARHIAELVQRLEGSVSMPPVRVQPVSSGEDIEGLATDVREQAGVGYRDAIPNLTRAVERAGVVVAILPTEIPDHYGYSVWPDFGLGGRPLIVVSSLDPGDRQRLTTAHELGHLLLHSPMRNEEVEPGTAEKEAYRFAGALLLPAVVAREAMKPPLTLTTLAHIKATFGISIGACLQRAKELELVTEARYESLRKQMTSRKWHREEPVRVEREQPLLIRRVIEAAGQGGTVLERAASLDLPAFAFRSLSQAN